MSEIHDLALRNYFGDDESLEVLSYRTDSPNYAITVEIRPGIPDRMGLFHAHGGRGESYIEPAKVDAITATYRDRTKAAGAVVLEYASHPPVDSTDPADYQELANKAVVAARSAYEVLA